MAAGINSRKGWQSGCMQGGTRLMDYKRTPTALSLARGLSQSDRLGPSVLSIHAMNLNQITISRQQTWDCAPVSRRHSRAPKFIKKQAEKERWEKKIGRRCNMTKAKRLSGKHFRICSWNCASTSRRGTIIEIPTSEGNQKNHLN